MTNAALQRAIDAAGGQNPLAKRIGVRQSTLWYWLRAKRGVPAEWCIAIQNETGVPAAELRPDVFSLDHAYPPLPQDDAENAGAERSVHEKTAASVSREAAL